MTIEDDYNDLIGEHGAPCFNLVLGLLSVVVNVHDPARVLATMRFLLRQPHILGVCVDLSDQIREDADGTILRRLLHPGPTGVADEDSQEEDEA
jgi:hypothetical protein